MSEITQYGLKRCSTCVKARKWLEGQGQQVRFIDYRDEPVDEATLAAWAQAAQGARNMINRSSQTWRTLPEDRKSPETEAQWLALAAAYPTLVKRPITVFPDGATTFGFSESTFASHLG